MPQVEINKIKCLRCGHEWVARTTDVRRCPKCQSPYWNKPRIKPIFTPAATIEYEDATPVDPLIEATRR